MHLRPAGQSPGLAGWDEAASGMWHNGFMQTSAMVEVAVPHRSLANVAR